MLLRLWCLVVRPAQRSVVELKFIYHAARIERVGSVLIGSDKGLEVALRNACGFNGAFTTRFAAYCYGE